MNYLYFQIFKIINNLYENGLSNLNINSKNMIYGYLNEILEHIRLHISKDYLMN